MAAPATGRVISFRRDEVTGAGTSVAAVDSTVTDTTEDANPHSHFSRPSVSREPRGEEHIVPIADLGTPELRLATPIYVVLAESDDESVAMSYDLELVESGATEFEALSNLRSAVVELYTALSSFDELPPHLNKKLEYLRSLQR